MNELALCIGFPVYDPNLLNLFPFRPIDGRDSST